MCTLHLCLTSTKCSQKENKTNKQSWLRKFTFPLEETNNTETYLTGWEVVSAVKHDCKKKGWIQWALRRDRMSALIHRCENRASRLPVIYLRSSVPGSSLSLCCCWAELRTMVPPREVEWVSSLQKPDSQSTRKSMLSSDSPSMGSIWTVIWHTSLYTLEFLVRNVWIAEMEKTFPHAQQVYFFGELVVCPALCKFRSNFSSN